MLHAMNRLSITFRNSYSLLGEWKEAGSLWTGEHAVRDAAQLRKPSRGAGVAAGRGYRFPLFIIGLPK
jgi:hypothetical protein